MSRVEIASLDDLLREELDSLRSRGLHRRLRQLCGQIGPRMTVDGRDVLMMAGADYLNLAGDSRVIAAANSAAQESGCAAGGARLISGNLSGHEVLEEELAEFLQTQAALLFSTGYMANVGVITALAEAGDVVLSDELNHASIIDGCRQSHAEVRTFRHNDVEDFCRVVDSLSGFRRYVLVVDGVFSMDGDMSPLAELVPAARERDVIVVVDDAHGCGVLGAGGRGVTELHKVDADIVIGNLGKAFGNFGAFVGCSQTMREYLINKCRTFVFTCGLPPGSVAGAREALRIMQAEPFRREALLERAGRLREGLQSHGYDTGRAETHIVPVIVGESEAALQLCEQAFDRGVFAQAIRYPSVPHGSARIRLSPSCGHTAEDIDTVLKLFTELRQSVLDD